MPGSQHMLHCSRLALRVQTDTNCTAPEKPRLCSSRLSSTAASGTIGTLSSAACEKPCLCRLHGALMRLPCRWPPAEVEGSHGTPARERSSMADLPRPQMLERDP